MPLPDALKMAQESDLDLVEVAPLATPPVCRIMDFRKWQYEEKQRAKESRRKASNVSVKEMKYRPKIGVGDFDTKTRKVAEFLSDGHKVKVTIMFRGREVFHPELGARILDHIAEDVAEVGKVETQGRLDGRNMTMVLAPDKKKVTTRRTDERNGPADEGRAGDNIGVLLRGTERKDIERGQVLAKPGSITPHTKFKGEVYVLTKEEGGRHTPFFNGYRPQFYFRTTDVTGVAHLPAGTEMVMPGDNTQMEIELIAPIAMEKGLRFAIREGGRTVGAGTVTEIVT